MVLSGYGSVDSVLLTPSVLGCIFLFVLLLISRFSTASVTSVGIEIVQTVAINHRTSVNPS